MDYQQELQKLLEAELPAEEPEEPAPKPEKANKPTPPKATYYDPTLADIPSAPDGVLCSLLTDHAHRYRDEIFELATPTQFVNFQLATGGATKPKNYKSMRAKVEKAAEIVVRNLPPITQSGEIHPTPKKGRRLLDGSGGTK